MSKGVFWSWSSSCGHNQEGQFSPEHIRMSKLSVGSSISYFTGWTNRARKTMGRAWQRL